MIDAKVAPITIPDSASTLAEADLVHVVCDCDEDIGLCGTDVTDVEWVMEPTTCVVCDDLDNMVYICPRCGD